MIKEKKKTSKYNITKTKNQIILEYVKTIFCSFAVSDYIALSVVVNDGN